MITQDDFFAAGAQAAKEETEAYAAGDFAAPAKPNGKAYQKLFQQHPEGGGPYQGRDNAITALVGYLRAKRLDYHAALWIAQSWNREFCFPPLTEDEVHDKMGVKWHQWQEPKEADAVPEDYQLQPEAPKERIVLTADELLDLEDNGHGQNWLIQNVFISGGIHFVSGPAAGGKSWVMLDLAHSITSGRPWMGEHQVEQGSVLYVDEEMGQQKTGHRVKKLGFGRGLPFYYLGKQGIQINNPADLKFIVQFCSENGIKLVCLDTLTGVRPGLMENEASHVSQLRQYFNDITNTGATLLVAHHDRKSGQGEQEVAHYRMAGSRDFGAMADMVYSIDKRGSYYTLSASKNRLLPDEDTINIDFALEDNEDKTGVVLRVLSASEKSSITLKGAEEKIIEVLTENGARMNSRAICEAVRGSTAATTAALRQMTEKGVIICEKEGQAKFYKL